MSVRFMAIICPSTAMYHLLFSCILLFFSCYVSNAPVYGAVEAKDGYHTFDISSMLPKHKCLAPAGGGSHGLPITYNHGPCSRLGQKKSPTRQQIFLQDQSRVRSINAKIFSPNKYSMQESKDGWTPESMLSINEDGTFLVNVGFGKPQQKFDLIIDTGSSITWIQCNSCLLEHCHNKNIPLFDPSLSSSYSNDTSCIPSTESNYSIKYGDKSYSEGVYGCDELTLNPDVFPKLQFGCSHKSGGQFGNASGLLGLAQGEHSLISQTTSKFKNIFSYCLPPHESTQGSLLFGDLAISPSPLLKFTRLLNPPSGLEPGSRGFYFVELTGISVAKKWLNISSSLSTSPGTIIDSGTVITRLPTEAYEALRTAFRQEMLHCPLTPPPPQEGLLDTCYNLTGCGKDVRIPEIVLHFGGGVDVSLHQFGILWGNDPTQTCLAFTGQSQTNELTIIGNRQQVSLKVVYDIEGRRLGFGDGCMY